MIPNLDTLRGEVRRVLHDQPHVAYAILFGSVARGEAHARSDIDIALGGDLQGTELLSLGAALEQALGHEVQVVAVRDAPPALRYRIFRDGAVLHEEDAARRVAEQARSIVEYLDFRPHEALCVQGVLRTRTSGDVDAR